MNSTVNVVAVVTLDPVTAVIEPAPRTDRFKNRCATCGRPRLATARQCRGCTKIYKYGAFDLLAQILVSAPKLQGAACRQNVRLFDGNTADDIAAAIAICRYGCPALSACRAWIKPNAETQKTRWRRRCCNAPADENQAITEGE